MSRFNGVPREIRTFMDAYYAGKEMAMLLNERGWKRRWYTHRARVWAKRWWAGYQRGFEADHGAPGGASRGPDGHWHLNRHEDAA